MRKRAFTLIEIIVTIGIIAILAALVYVAFGRFRARARLTRITVELDSIANSASLYAQDNNFQYPPDVARGVPPPGLVNYLSGGAWPTSVYPYGVFDWDNWTTINGAPSPQILQITYRLCGTSDPLSACSDPVLFPHFGRDSSIFYCIQGPCVPHQNDTIVPGYCVNCKPKEVNPPI
jgi:prepilin-type N-terminal cleavage/methylation domain-containing protein